MRLSICSLIVLGFLNRSLAGPVALIPVRSPDLDIYNHLDQRFPSFTLATYDLGTSRQSEVLLDL